jgi:uncharacterized protein
MKPTLRAAAAALALLSFAARAPAQQKTEPPHVSVAGEAELNVRPDEVRFDVTVQAFHKELKTAKTQVDDRLKGLVAIARKQGVADSDTQTDYVKVETRYKSGDAAKAILGYTVRKDFVLTLRDIGRAEGLLSELLDYGVTRINSITFSTSKMRQYRDEARAQAMKAAQEKAAALAGAVGQRIGKALVIEEVAPSQSGYLANLSANSVSYSRGDDSDTEGTFEIGLIKVSARVTVKFELE